MLSVLKRFRGENGVTLVEVMVAVTILTVGVLAYFTTFRFITKSSHTSTATMLASNIARSELENFKSQNYYSVAITTDTQWIQYVRGYPVVTNWYHMHVDKGSYPPLPITISGVTFWRFVNVSFAQYNPASGVVTGLSATYPDTGVKQIQVMVGWCDAGEPCNSTQFWHMQTASSLMLNPNLDKFTATISGHVKDGSNNANLPNVNIKTIENPNWKTTTNGSGDYSFRVLPGTYTLSAYRTKYLPATSPTYFVGTQGSVNWSPSLTPILTGKVGGKVWLNEELVISQVVAAYNTKAYWTYPAPGGDTSSLIPNTTDVTYIELFNPTTWQINLYDPVNHVPKKFYINLANSVSGTPGQFQNTFYDVMAISTAADPNFSQFVTTYIPPRGYYLIANYPAFDTPGGKITADAYWYNSPPPASFSAFTPAIPTLDPKNMGAVQICLFNAANCPSRYAPCTPCPSLPDYPNWSDPHTAPLVRDQVCWSGSDGTPDATSLAKPIWGWCHGGRIPLACGLMTKLDVLGNPVCDAGTNGDQLLRFSYTDPDPAAPTATCADMWSHLQRPYGPAYQTYFSSQDFSYPAANFPNTIGNACFLNPSNSSSYNIPTIGGLPAFDFRKPPYNWSTSSVGAAVQISTDESATPVYATVASTTNFLNNTQYYSTFTIVDASTGYWKTAFSYYQYLSGGYTSNGTGRVSSGGGLTAFTSYAEVNNVSVITGGLTMIPNSATIPTPQVAGMNDTMLQLPPTVGGSSISGKVFDINGVPIPNITVVSGSVGGQTAADGSFILYFPNYTLLNLVVNPNNLNPAYVSQWYRVQLGVGASFAPDFFLPSSNLAIGLMTTDGTTPLPNQPVTATNFGGMTAAGSAVSDGSGYFYIHNVTTGDVTFIPNLSAGQSSSPLSQTVTVAGTGGNVWVATFTISGALGKLSGTVSRSGGLVKTGALILASTDTLTNTMTSSPAAGTAPVYSTWSDGKGRYSLSAGVASGYHVRVVIPAYNSNGTPGTFCSADYPGVNIPAGGASLALVCP